MISSENRFPLFRIMHRATQPCGGAAAALTIYMTPVINRQEKMMRII